MHINSMWWCCFLNLLEIKLANTFILSSGFTWIFITALAPHCFAAPTQRTDLGGVIGREHPSCGVGCSLLLSFTHVVLRMAAAPIVERMGLLTIRQLTIAACHFSGHADGRTP
jgi:hypothetical protein